jgi:hypothetical protein
MQSVNTIKLPKMMEFARPVSIVSLEKGIGDKTVEPALSPFTQEMPSLDTSM